MKSFFTIYLIVLFFSSYAQEPGFKLYTTKHGLVGNQVWGMKQDSKGFLWLATTQGLSRFDGLVFKNFTKKNGLTGSFLINIDIEGDTLFILEKNVIDIIIKDTVFKYYENNKLKLNRFIHLDGKLFLLCEELNTDKFILFDLSNRTFNNEYSNMLNTEKSDNYFYTNSNTFKIINRKIYKISKNNISIKPIINNLPDNKYIKTFYLTNDNKAFIIINDNNINQIANELRLIDSTGNILKTYNLLYIDKENKFGKPFPVSENLIVLTDNKGFNYLLEDEKISKIRYNFYGCTNIIKDTEDNIWVATDRGLVKIFYKGFINFPAIAGYPENIWGIFPEDKEKTWFCSYNSGLYCYQNGECVQHINKINNKLLCPYFGAVKGFNNDFIIPDARGLIVFDLKKQSFSLLERNIRKSSLFATVDNIDNKIIFGSMSDLCVLNKNYSIDSICSVKNFGSSKAILSCVRKNNNYYLACSDDILEFNLTTKKGKWFNLKNVRFNSIVKDYKNNLWTASDDGIYYFTSKDTILFLDNEYFLAIAIDKKNRLFAVSNNGLFKLNLESFYKNKKADFEFYGEDEGFSGAGDQNAFFMDDEGNLWLPGSENSVKIIPEQLIIKENKLSPLIENVFIKDNINNELKISYLNNSSFSYKWKNINFSFLAPCLSSPEKVKYQYRLTGLSETWSLPTKNREAVFTNLSHGNYTFELRASTNDHFENAHIVRFLFTITPPFWQTWWFYSLISIFIIGVIVLIFLWQLRRLRKRSLIRQKISRLETDLLRMQIEPHFVGNSLEVIKNFINNNRIKKAIAAIDSFGSLLRYVAETTRKSQISLENEFQMLKNYVVFQKLKCGDSFDFIINIADSIDISEISIPPLLIQPFVENAIIHGLKHKQGKGNIQIKVQQLNNEFVKIIVADNGVGRINSGKYNSTEKEHKSMGIENAKERLKIFNRTNSENIEFVDKADGTDVILMLRI